MLSPKQRERGGVVFEAFDKDKDGILATADLEDALRAMGLNPTADEMADIREDAGSRGLSLNAFLYVLYRHSRYVDIEDEIVRIFQAFDKERTGRLPVAEVRRILAGAPRPFTKPEIDAVLSHAETADGVVDYADLVATILAL
jgi:calmodulin